MRFSIRTLSIIESIVLDFVHMVRRNIWIYYHSFAGEERYNVETIRLGSRGPTVELLQLALTRAGYNPGGIDGVFGVLTQAALIRYQRDYGLSPDGIAGPLTWARIRPYLVGYVRHTVRAGETFWNLAFTYNTSSDAIAVANPSVNPQQLRIGQSLVIPLGFEVVPTNISYTSTLVALVVEGLRVRYPFIETGSAGSSILGRPLYYLAMGNADTEVFYNASHHANEWITTPLLLKFLEEYAEAYAIRGTIFLRDAVTLYNTAKLYMIPLVNPDGVDLVTGAIPPGSRAYENARALAQNYPSIPFPSGWKANIAGVDLNLQYPAGWTIAREQKFAQGFTLPGPRDYVGPGPLTEPESLAIYNFTLSHDFALTLSYHTQGQVIFWRFLDYMPPRSLEIAQRFSDVSGYPYEDTPAYSGYAGYKDWFIQTYNRPGYTIEAGLGENPLPLSQFNEIYVDNVGILTLGIELA
mgnify:FL=1|jgi:g-D-glutamyl-meso-diaminopimelate peptidase